MKRMLCLTAFMMGYAGVANAANMSQAEIQSHIDDKLKTMDTNGDRLVSKSEHENASGKMFKDTDTNNDDQLSRQEMIDHKMQKAANRG